MMLALVINSAWWMQKNEKKKKIRNAFDAIYAVSEKVVGDNLLALLSNKASKQTFLKNWKSTSVQYYNTC